MNFFVLCREDRLTHNITYARSGSPYCTWDSDVYGAAEFSSVGTCKALLTKNKERWNGYGHNPIPFRYFVLEISKILTFNSHQIAL